LRFDDFTVHRRERSLRKGGIRLKLHGQPFEILLMLLDHQGEVVTREELQTKIWKGDTFVDFENGLNAAIKKLRQALGDSAESPVYRNVAAGWLPLPGARRRLKPMSTKYRLSRSKSKALRNPQFPFLASGPRSPGAGYLPQLRPWLWRDWESCGSEERIQPPRSAKQIPC
jgi:hypothetical protein